MNILVCMKQVFDDSVEVTYDETDGKFVPENIEKVENAFDTYALEMATRLKESVDGKITLLSIGNESAKTALKNGLAVGGDFAMLIENDEYQDSDALGVAKALAAGIEKIEAENRPFDLIFCGKETTDFAAGQVGIMLANILKRGVITDLLDIEFVQEKVVGKHETETGYELIESACPCVVTVSKPLYDPRYATIKSKMAARKKSIEVLSGISVDTDILNVLSTHARPKRGAGVKITHTSPEEVVAEAITCMSDAKVL